jgi:hypothetical protein
LLSALAALLTGLLLSAALLATLASLLAALLTGLLLSALTTLTTLLLATLALIGICHRCSPVGEFPEQYNVYSYYQFLEDCTLMKLERFQ